MEVNLTLENKNELARLADMFPKAAAAALNKVNNQTFTLGRKTVLERYNLPASKFTQRFVKAKATPHNLAVGFYTRGRPLSLSYFAARQQKAGTSVEVIRGRRLLLRGRFIATMSSGHKGVFERPDVTKRIKRISPTTGKTYRSAMPIVEKVTISGGEMLIASKVQAVLDRFINEKLPELLNHEIEWRTK